MRTPQELERGLVAPETLGLNSRVEIREAAKHLLAELPDEELLADETAILPEREPDEERDSARARPEARRLGVEVQRFGRLTPRERRVEREQRDRVQRKHAGKDVVGRENGFESGSAYGVVHGCPPIFSGPALSNATATRCGSARNLLSF